MSRRPPTLRLVLQPAPDGNVRVAATRGEGVAVEASLPGASDQLGRLLADLDRAWPPIVLPGRDAAVCRAEEAWGAAVADLLLGQGEVMGTLARTLGAAQATGQPLVLAVQADEPLDALPWELLGTRPGGPALEDEDLGLVVRLVPGSPARPSGPRTMLLRWCPTPDDPICRGRIEALDALEQELGLRWIDLPQDLDHLPELEAGAILHVVGHGDRVEQWSALITGQEAQATGRTSAMLAPLLRFSAVVLLEVCHSGQGGVPRLEQLGPRLVAAGATRVLAPRGRAGAEAMAAVAEGFYRCLHGGGSLARAVMAGRRTLRSLGIPHPEARWHLPSLYLSDASGLDHAPLAGAAGWRPEGWPVPVPELGRMLDAARALAEEHGFVGLEHLALATVVQGDSDLEPAIRIALAAHAPVLRAQLAALRLRPDGGPPSWAGTPRLQALADRLPASPSLADLWRCVIAEGGHDLPLPAPIPDDAPRPAGGLEIQGGPEDGRQLALAPGASIGRARSDGRTGATAPLYGGCVVHDASLSRSPTCTWLGGGQLRVEQRPLYLLRRDLPPGSSLGEATLDDLSARPQAERLQPGDTVVLAIGDRLVLTLVGNDPVGGFGGEPAPLTRLRGIEAPS